MKKNILFIAWVALFSLFASNSQAQSLKDLLNKDNISKVVILAGKDIEQCRLATAVLGYQPDTLSLGQAQRNIFE